jgi:RNA polymerase sigma-70 factor, ECF subfamily
MAHLNEMEVQELVTDLKGNDKVAFSVLYDSYAAALFGVISRMVTDKDIAEELLQDTFIKIWKHIDLYNATKGTLFTWMLNIARNTCKDYFRSKQHRFKMQVTENGLEYLENKATGDCLNYREALKDVKQLAQKLDVKYKKIIDLVYFLGYSQQEVATLLNIPLGTVKTRSCMALKILREIYQT